MGKATAKDQRSMVPKFNKLMNNNDEECANFAFTVNRPAVVLGGSGYHLLNLYASQ